MPLLSELLRSDAVRAGWTNLQAAATDEIGKAVPNPGAIPTLHRSRRRPGSARRELASGFTSTIVERRRGKDLNLFCCIWTTCRV